MLMTQRRKMSHCLPTWVIEATSLPLAFAQVREDPLLDLWLVQQLRQHARVMMVASGGCTAALLASTPYLSQIHLVDPNPAQLALCKLKLHLLNHHEPAFRLALLGHTPMADRATQLQRCLFNLDLAAYALGPLPIVAQLGPDYAGRYELLFTALRAALLNHQDEWLALLQLDDLQQQSERITPASRLGDQLDTALDEVMALPHLISLFGEKATNNPIEPFTRHFASRIRHALTTMPAYNNPYLWQMLLGYYPQSHAAPWLPIATPRSLPDISYSPHHMDQALKDISTAYDMIHLSNILDWLTAEEASRTLQLAWEGLRPGGYVIIRQLNSSLDIPRLGQQFHWLSKDSARLLAQDRSFFYRSIHLGRKN